MVNKWDKRFVLLAKHVSEWSRDPSTKVGAVIVRPDKTVSSLGFNGFPRGMSDAEELYRDRGVKYDRIIHSEMNAILSANEPVKGHTLYIWPFLSCGRCTIHVIQAGIKRVVAPYSDNPRWLESFERSQAYYREANVEVELINEADLFDRVTSEPGCSTHC